ncbi:MAG: hypothetical protein AB7R55_22905 [Gemmatimonadales bacterium]
MIRRATALVFTLVFGGAGALVAQVGHDPASSPYRDLRYNQFLQVTAGYIGGAGGKLGLGPHDGRVFTFRHDFLADRALTIGLGGGYGQLDRSFVDLEATVEDQRILGPERHRVMFGEGVIQLNATGGKTWHGLAPYVSGALGLAFAQRVEADSSGYKFGTKFYFAPAIGVRAFVTRRLFIRLEARAMFWNLGYPASYQTTDPDGTLGPLSPILAGQGRKEWAPVPMLHAGLGFAFHRPFF